MSDNVTVDAAFPWQHGQIATRRRFVPNVPVVTHRGERRMFYDDLIKDRTVVVQFFSLVFHHNYPVTRNMVHLQKQLADRMGKDVFLYSITTDPINDNPTALAEFAQRHRAGDGWTFLTGEPASIEIIQRVFFFHGSAVDSNAPVVSHTHVGGEVADCSMGLLRYGNDAAGLWGSVPTRTEPAQIVERLNWIQPDRRDRRITVGGQLRRGGPHPLQPG
jgi:protein SCO1/2